MLNDLEDTLYRNGLYYRNKFKKTKEQELHYAAVDWESLRKGQPLAYKQIERIYGYMKENVDKNKLKGMIKESSYDFAALKQSYGLKTDAVWFEAFDDAPGRDVNYLRKMRNNGEKLNEGPRITLSTIHGAKGGESQNVVLLTDLSENTMKAYEKNADDENRLFYVGATRTKEHLHIISPKQEYKGYKI
jgi:superfamily I DNA/RNA helicase